MATSNYTPNHLVASGSTNTYTYTFEIQSDEDIDVYLDDVLKTLTTDYTVTGAGTDAGGTVVFVSTPAVNTAITFKRSVSDVRLSDFQQTGDYRAATINNELDRLTMRDQEVTETFGRAIKFAATSQTTNVTFPEPSADKVIGWNTGGTDLENKTVATLGAVVLSDTSPANLGTAAAGSSTEVSRQDHVHKLPTGAELSLEIGVDVQAYDANTAKTNIAQVFTKQQTPVAGTLTDGANIAWDLSIKQVATVTLAGNRTLDNPTNQVAGTSYQLIVKQDASGSRTLSFGTVYKFAGGVVPTLTATANAIDILTFYSDGTNMLCTGQSQALA